MNRTLRTSLLALSALTFSTAIAAQPLNTFTMGVSHSIWPSAVPSGSGATLAVTGHFTGTGYPDVLQVLNGKPYIWQSPAVSGAWYALPWAHTGVTSICSRQPAAGDMRREALITDANGLTLMSVGSQGPAILPIPILGWQNARFLVSADFFGDSVEDVLALAADGRTVMILPVQSWGIATPITRDLGGQVGGLASILWPTSTGVQRMVVYSMGNSLYRLPASLTGAPTLITTAGAAVTVGLATIQSSPTQSVLAWCTKSSGGAWLSRIVPPATSTAQAVIQQCSFTGHNVIAMGAGDLDLDGDEELVFSQTTRRKLLGFVHRATGFGYSIGDAFEIKTVTSNDELETPTGATPIVADLDGDGDGDASVALQFMSKMGLQLSPAVSQAAVTPAIAKVDAGDNVNSYAVSIYPQAPADATELEVTTWPMIEVGEGYAVSGPASGCEKLPTGSRTIIISGQSQPVLAWLRYRRVVNNVVVRTYPPKPVLLTREDEEYISLRDTYSTLASTFAWIVVISFGDGGTSGGHVGLILPPPPLGGIPSGG